MEPRTTWLPMAELLDAINTDLNPDEEPMSERTVRYYVAEGLLPRPERSGQRALYHQGHLDRLRLIKRLKEVEFMPLYQIKETLLQLDDAEVREALARSDEPAPRAHAKGLIDRLLKERSLHPSSTSFVQRAAPAPHAAPAPREERWRHIELADGVVLLVRQPAKQESEEYVRRILALPRTHQP